MSSLTAAASDFSYSSSSQSPKFGTYLGYGISIPKSFGGGVSFYRFFNIGLSGTAHSTALTGNVNARATDAIISPIFGLSVNWYQVKAGDVSAAVYSDGINGIRLTMNAGLGIQPSPGFYIDGGVTYIRNGDFQPYVMISWPIKLDLN